MSDANNARIVISWKRERLLHAMDAIQSEVVRRRVHVSSKEIAAEVRAFRAERRRRG